MDRRHFLKTAAATLALGNGAPVAPAVCQRAAAGMLRFIPHHGLASMDPIWSNAHGTRNAAALVWDTLYGLDAELKPRRQMIEYEAVSDDHLAWTFRLREGLRFHNGEPVLATDAVASINRWAARDRTAAMIKDREEELAVLDDRTFRWVLKRAFPKMPLVLGKIVPPCCFIMPESIATADPFEPIDAYVGSGPMRFVVDDWVPGERAVFEQFSEYVPRPEPASWLAGGKRMLVDRIAWITVADPATAAAMLERDDADWWEHVPASGVPALRSAAKVSVEIRDPLGDIGFIGLNQLARPFDDLSARRALLALVSQRDFMRAALGGDEALWRPMAGFFPPASPLYNEQGGDILKGPGALDGAKSLLMKSGYAGEPVACLVVTDDRVRKAFAEQAIRVLEQLGIKTEQVMVDTAGMTSRRDRGGWNLCPDIVPSADGVYPMEEMLRVGGEVAANGWSDIPDVEAAVYGWFDARIGESDLAAARELNQAALDNAISVPLGVFLSHHAWRHELSGVGTGPLPFMWGVSKSL